MKKILVVAASLAVALVGFASLGTPGASADPSTVWVVNAHVVDAVLGQPIGTFTCTAAGADAAAGAVSLDTLEAASGDQLNSDTTNAGASCIIVQTDGSVNPVTVNGRGLTLGAVDGPAPGTNGVFAAIPITNNGTFTSGNTVSVTQDTIAVDSKALTTAKQAQNVTLASVSDTIQEGATACGTSTATPNKTAAGMTYTDIDGTDLVGYVTSWSPLFSTSGKAGVAAPGGPGSVGPPVVPPNVSKVQADGTTITAANLICGANAGTQTITAKTAAGAIAGVTGQQSRTLDITVTGVPAAVTLASAPTAISCNGTATSTVTATVKDSAGNNVVDGTAVTFSVVALGTANPINTTTKAGVATSVITPLSGNNAGTVVNVTSGNAAASIRIDCLPSLATATAAAAATATPVGGIVGPNTGTGGYLGQDSGSSFPMWALAALALGSLVLVGGGIAARRAGK